MKRLIPAFVVLFLLLACSTSKKAQETTLEVTSTPDYTTDTTIEDKENKVVEVHNKAREQITHVVKKGESLWVIAQQYGVTVKDIVEANNIENPNLIKIGLELMVPKK